MIEQLERGKAQQACHILAELGMDGWLIWVRETMELCDPALRIVFEGDVVWPAAFLFTRSGHRYAIAGRYDIVGIPEGAFDRVIAYDESIRGPLRELLESADPQSIAVNTSRSDVAADGLTVGMRDLLEEYLTGTEYLGRLCSAEAVVGRLRGRKLPEEIARIRRAVRQTEEIFSAVYPHLKPGQTEIEIYDRFHREMDARGVEAAWTQANDPAVDAGPDKTLGHGGPTANRTKSGHLLHFDFGVKVNGYCSDLQRMVFFGPRSRIPQAVAAAFNTVRDAIQEAAAALRPGRVGWEIDAVARQYVIDRGYPEFMHGLGHQVGRSAHDGGTLLAPRWERYRDTPLGTVEAGNVFTLELHVPAGGYGQVSLEEDVVVTETGCEFLSNPQHEIICCG